MIEESSIHGKKKRLALRQDQGASKHELGPRVSFDMRTTLVGVASLFIF